MKNFKKKFLGLSVVLSLFLCSCEIDELNDETSNQNLETINAEKEYVYSSKYNSAFSYYHKNTKLTDINQINEMLDQAIYVFYNGDKIEISMTENEKNENLKKNNIPSDNLKNDLVNNLEARTVPQVRNLKYSLFDSNTKVRLSGTGEKSYGAFRPYITQFTGIKGTIVNVYYRSGGKTKIRAIRIIIGNINHSAVWDLSKEAPFEHRVK